MRELVTILRRLRRRVGAARPVRTFTDAAPVARLVSLLTYSRLTASPFRFLAHELRRDPHPRVYRLRESGVAVTVRHRTPDLFTFDQVFNQGHLAPPASARERLAGASSPLKVVDLGANIGMFGAYVLQRFPVERMIAFEPDPGNVDVLRETVRVNDGEIDWQVIAACAGISNGSVRFAPDEFGRSRIATDGDRRTIDVEEVDALPYMAGADLVKIDVEGAEWKILADPRFAHLSTPVICLEYHPQHCPAAEPRQAARAALERAGFLVTPASDNGPTTGMFWAWKPR